MLGRRGSSTWFNYPQFQNRLCERARFLVITWREILWLRVRGIINYHQICVHQPICFIVWNQLLNLKKYVLRQNQERPSVILLKISNLINTGDNILHFENSGEHGKTFCRNVTAHAYDCTVSCTIIINIIREIRSGVYYFRRCTVQFGNFST